jgi:hypothetical protein
MAQAKDYFWPYINYIRILFSLLNTSTESSPQGFRLPAYRTFTLCAASCRQLVGQKIGVDALDDALNTRLRPRLVPVDLKDMGITLPKARQKVAG